MRKTMPAELNGDLNAWISAPLAAFNTFVRSEAFLLLGRYEAALDRYGNPYPLHESSVALYTSMFQVYVRWLVETGRRFDQVASADLLGFLDWFPKEQKRQKERVSSIRRRYVLLLERIYKYVGFRGVANPATHLVFTDKSAKAGTLGRELPMQVLLPEQIRAFMAALPDPMDPTVKSPWKQYRDRAMLAVLIGAGLRASEVLVMKKRWVKTDDTGRVHIHVPKLGGVHKEHSTVLEEAAAAVVLEWMDQRKLFKVRSPLMFPASLYNDKRLTNMTLYRKVQQTFRKAGIDLKHAGSRVLRNTFAVRELEATADDMTVTEYLGLFRDKSLADYKDILKRLPAASHT